MQRYTTMTDTKPQQKHRLGTVSEKTTEGWGGGGQGEGGEGGGGVLPWYTQEICSVRAKRS